MVKPPKTSMIDQWIITNCLSDPRTRLTRICNLPRLSNSLVLLLGPGFAISYPKQFIFFSLGGGGPISISLIALLQF